MVVAHDGVDRDALRAGRFTFSAGMTAVVPAGPCLIAGQGSVRRSIQPFAGKSRIKIQITEIFDGRADTADVGMVKDKADGRAADLVIIREAVLLPERLCAVRSLFQMGKSGQAVFGETAAGFGCGVSLLLPLLIIEHRVCFHKRGTHGVSPAGFKNLLSLFTLSKIVDQQQDIKTAVLSGGLENMPHGYGNLSPLGAVAGNTAEPDPVPGLQLVKGVVKGFVIEVIHR